MPYILSFLLVLLSACDSGPNPNLALGTLERDRIAHTATVNEVVVALPMQPGSVVSEGTLLVQLDDTLQTARLRKAEADVAQAEANLEKLRRGARPEELAAASARVAGAKAALQESQANYARTKNLAQQQVVSQSVLDKALALRDANAASLQSAEEEFLKLSNGTRSEDLRIGEALLAAAKAALASESKKLADLRVVATRDGVLDNLPWNLGERATIGSPLAIVLAGKAPFARVYIPEPYRVKLAVGNTLQVHVDGLDRAIAGSLRWIASEPAFTPYYALNAGERARLMYLAEVQLPDAEANLPSGVPVQVELP